MEYFCKDHSQLCCVACISKIKGKGNGEHSDCNICFIEDIKDEANNKLKDNIKTLEELSKTVEESINQLKEIYNKINNTKQELKNKIAKIFTKIRDTINEREDKILLEVDKKFEEIYFKEEIIKKMKGWQKMQKNLWKMVKKLIKNGMIIIN